MFKSKFNFFDLLTMGICSALIALNRNLWEVLGIAAISLLISVIGESLTNNR